MAVNSVTVIGNLGGDPQTRSLPSGDSVANFTLATTERFKDRACRYRPSLRTRGSSAVATAWPAFTQMYRLLKNGSFCVSFYGPFQPTSQPRQSCNTSIARVFHASG
jgi:hypothetical protein